MGDPVVLVCRTEDGSDERRLFWCKGCETHHAVRVRGGEPCWGYNWDDSRPTFTPSVLVRSRLWDEAAQAHHETVCHTFVTDGRVQYLGDCTHSLAGQTIDLEPGSF